MTMMSSFWRALGVAAALFLCSAFVLPSVSKAQVDLCCDVNYANNTDCPITFCMRTVSGPLCVTVPAHNSVVVTLPPDICSNAFVFYTTDRCNNTVKLPYGCTNVALAPNCCAQICVTTGIVGCWFVTATPIAKKCLCPLEEQLGQLQQ